MEQLSSSYDDVLDRYLQVVKKPPILPRGKTAWGVVKWVRVVKTEGENSNARCIDLSCSDKCFATARGAWTGAHQFDVVK